MKYAAGILVTIALLSLFQSRLAAAEPGPLEFTKLLAHWIDYGDPDYVTFVGECQPDIAQVGFYGGHFWSLVHSASYGGYPANLPVRGLDECGQLFEDLNKKLHQLNVKVVGHFNIEFLVGDPESPEGPRGFFKFYRDLWNEEQLGPKPVADPLQMMERSAHGSPITNRTYAVGGMTEYWACLRNPAWQEVLKAWIRQGLKRGLDGFIINYFYKHDCLCQYCQKEFRDYLRGRFSDEQLRGKFGITDLATYQFKEIVYWHEPNESTPLRLEELRFSQISNKKVFDDLFVKYGRSLKPDLIVAQWNHLGNFSQVGGDERCLLPADLWGKDETYLWYSTGGVANFTDIKNRVLGDATLHARYIRSSFQDKPFTLGKYESTRIRAAMAELSANGGAPMGFYTDFKSPEARKEIVRHYQFLRRYDSIFRANRSWADVALMYPRQKVHQGLVEPVDKFKKLGKALLDEHILFDVVPDDLGTKSGQHRSTVTVDTDPEKAVAQLPKQKVRFEAPFSVRVSASQPAGDTKEIDLHFLNYNRVEPPPTDDGKPSPGRGIGDEKPIPVSGVRVTFQLPAGARLASVEFIAPEQPDPKRLEVSTQDGEIQFALPEFVVYGVSRIRLQ